MSRRREVLAQLLIWTNRFLLSVYHFFSFRFFKLCISVNDIAHSGLDWTVGFLVRKKNSFKIPFHCSISLLGRVRWFVLFQIKERNLINNNLKGRSAKRSEKPNSRKGNRRSFPKVNSYLPFARSFLPGFSLPDQRSLPFTLYLSEFVPLTFFRSHHFRNGKVNYDDLINFCVCVCAPRSLSNKMSISLLFTRLASHNDLFFFNKLR